MYINSNYNIPFKSSILIEKGYCIETKQIKKYFLKSLQELKRRIIENFNKLSYYKNKSNSDELINNLKNLFSSIEVVLGQIEEYENEFHNYCRIEIMSIYILEHDYLSNDNLKFIKEMLNSFYDIINLKSNFKDYNHAYDKFTSELIKWEQYFYTEIYIPSDNYDEENLSKITNGLLK